MLIETISFLKSIDAIIYADSNILKIYTATISILFLIAILRSFNKNDKISDTKSYSQVTWMYLTIFIFPFLISLFIFNSIFLVLPISILLVISVFIFRSYKNRNNPRYIAQTYSDWNENINDAICAHCQSRIIRKWTNSRTKYWNEYSCECSKWEWVVWDHKEWTYVWPIRIVEWQSSTDILYWRGYKI